MAARVSAWGGIGVQRLLIPRSGQGEGRRGASEFPAAVLEAHNSRLQGEQMAGEVTVRGEGGSPLSKKHNLKYLVA